MRKADQTAEAAATHASEPEEMRRIVAALAAAKSKQDVQAAMAIYHPDCVLEAPSLLSRHQGEDRIRAALQAFFGRFPDYAVSLDGQAVSGDVLIAWGTIHLTLSGEAGGETPNGKRASVPVFILFRFADGQVIWESFNFDLATLCRQAGVSTAALLPAGHEVGG